MDAIWKAIVDALKEFGLTKGLFLIAFIAIGYEYLRSQRKRLEDKDTQINRLADENHEYREKFMKLVDEKYKIEGKKK